MDSQALRWQTGDGMRAASIRCHRTPSKGTIPMKKLVNCLGLLVAMSALGTLAGCELYFGPDHGNDWSYCGADGQYNCTGNDCHWVSSTCTTSNGSGGGGGGVGTGSGSGGTTGSECTSNAQC